MPIYEYQCQSCGEMLEALQRVSDEPLRDCPACGKPALRKRVSAVAFRLKGGGWYETDFKTGDKKNLVGADGKSGGADAEGAKSKGGKPESGGKAEGAGKTDGAGNKGSKSDTGTAKPSS
jgi:putative FmdB family regulatory protein